MSFLSCSEDLIINQITSERSEPIIFIDKPKSEKIVFEEVYIKVKTTIKDDDIKSVNFFIDDSLFYEDLKRPFDTTWNTTGYPNNTEHFIKAILYNNTSDTIESESIKLIIDNSSAAPNPIDITSVTYDTTQVINDLVEFIIMWSPSMDSDFKSYTLLHAETKIGIKDSIFLEGTNLDTIYSTTDYKPNIEHWFWILVSDEYGLTNLGTGNSNKTKTIPPDTSTLNPIIFENGFQISWTKCNNQDFNLYRLLQSDSEEMNDSIVIAEFTDSLETSYLIQEQELKYYQIATENIWGLTSYSNIKASDYIISIGSDTFSVLNTINLSQINLNPIENIPLQIGELINLQWVDLSSYEISGAIPPEIGKLTKLKYLNLSNNQLSEEIPTEIENLINLEYLNLSNNQLSEEIPTEIENLINLEYLNLSNNQLSEEIPFELWNLINLKKIRLNNNNFSGIIISEIENLINADIIEFQENQFLGILPDEVCFFYEKEIFINFRYNNLCPPYPDCSLINEYFIDGQDTTNCN